MTTVADDTEMFEKRIFPSFTALILPRMTTSTKHNRPYFRWLAGHFV